jgi:hypothetical protein
MFHVEFSGELEKIFLVVSEIFTTFVLSRQLSIYKNMSNLLFVIITEEVNTVHNTAFGSERYAVLTQEEYNEFRYIVGNRDITRRIEKDIVKCSAYTKLFPNGMQDVFADEWSLEAKNLSHSEFEAMRVVQKFFPITL